MNDFKIILQTILDSNSTKSINSQINSVGKNLNGIPIRFDLDKSELARIKKEMDGLINSTYGRNYNTLSVQVDSSIKEAEKASKSFSAQLKEQMTLRAKDEVAAKKQADAQEKLNFKLEEFKKINISKLDRMSVKGNISTNEIERLKAEILSLDGANEKVSQSMKSLSNDVDILGRSMSGSSNSISKMMGMYFGINEAIQLGKRGISSAVSSVFELDEAITNLNKVADISNMDSYVKSMYDLGETLALTGSQLTEISSGFARAGYTERDLKLLTEVGGMMINVADANMTLDDSVGAIVSSLKGFKLPVEESMDLLHAMNNVANNSNTTMSDLTMSLQRNSAVMGAFGVEYQRVLGMFSAAQEILMAPEVVSRGLNSITMRMRGLEESGEAIDGLVPKLKSLYSEIGVTITDSEGQMLDIYTIMDNLNEVWDTLTENQKQFVAQKSAGVDQAKVFITLQENWSRATEITSLAVDHQSSALTENQRAIESLAGHVNNLKSAWEQMSTNTLSSGTIKSILGIATGFIKIVDSIGVLNVSLVALAGTMAVVGKAKGIAWMATIPSLLSTITTGVGTLTTTLMSNPLFLGAVALVSTIKLIDAVTVSIDEQKEKVSKLTEEYNALKLEVEKLKSVEVKDRTPEYEQNLKYKQMELEATKQILALENKKLADKEIYGKGVLGKGVLGDVDDTLRNIDMVQVAISNVKAEIDSLSGSDDVYSSDQIKYLSDHLGNLKGQLTGVVPELVSTYNTLENSLQYVDDAEKENIQTKMDSISKYLEMIDASNKLTQSTEELAEAQAGIDDNNIDSSSGEGLSRLASEFQAVADKSNLLKTAIYETEAYIEANKNGTVDMADALIFTEKTLESLAKKYPDLLNCMEDEEKLLAELNRLYMEDARAETLKGLQNSYKNATSSLADLNGILKEYDKYSKISQGSMDKIIATYPDMLSAMGDEESFRNALIQKIAEQESAQAQSLGQMLVNQEEYAEVLKQIDNQMYQELLEYYQVYNENYAAAMSGEVEAWGKMSQAKADITATLIQKLGEAWSKYFSAISKGFATLGATIPTLDENKVTHSADITPEMWENMSGLEKSSIENMKKEVREGVGAEYAAIGEALHDVVAEINTDPITINIPVDTNIGGGDKKKTGKDSKSAVKEAEKALKEQFDNAVKVVQDARNKLDQEITLVEGKLSLAKLTGDQSAVEKYGLQLDELYTKRTKLTEQENVEYRALAKKYTQKEQLDKLESLMAENSKQWYKDREKDITQSIEYTRELAEAEREIYDLRLKEIDSEQGNLSSTSDSYMKLEYERLEIMKFKQQSYEKELQALKQKGYESENEQVKEVLEKYKEINLEVSSRQIKIVELKLEANINELNNELRDLEIEQMLGDPNKTAKFEERRADIIIKSQEAINAALQELYNEGYTDEHQYIQDLKNEYFKYQKDIINIYKSIGEERKKLQKQSMSKDLEEAKKAQSSIQTLLSMTMDMLKQKYNDEMSSLKDLISKEEERVRKQIDGIKKEADERKKALRKQSDERSYNKELDKKKKDIKKIEDQLLELSNDNSAAATKKKLELQELLKEKKEELDDFLYENDIKKQEEAIDDELKLQEDKLNKELEAFKKEKEDQIKALEEYLRKEGNIRDEALALIENKNSDLYEQLMAWNDEYAKHTKAEITDAWENATSALEQFGTAGEGVHSIMGSIADSIKKITSELEKLDLSDWRDFVDEDDYAPSKPTDKPNVENKPDESKPVMSEKDAKAKEQANQQKFLHNKMVEAQKDNNKQLENWVKKERPKWGLNPDSGAIEGDISKEVWDKIKHNYGFMNGGLTSRTGMHWLDGEMGKPERVLSAQQTKAFDMMINKYMPAFNANMEVLEKVITKPSTNSGEVTIEQTINIQGTPDESILKALRKEADNIAQTTIGMINNTLGLRGHSRGAKAVSI